jgi:hypothetical protein
VIAFVLFYTVLSREDDVILSLRGEEEFHLEEFDHSIMT